MNIIIFALCHFAARFYTAKVPIPTITQTYFSTLFNSMSSNFRTLRLYLRMNVIATMLPNFKILDTHQCSGIHSPPFTRHAKAHNRTKSKIQISKGVSLLRSPSHPPTLDNSSPLLPHTLLSCKPSPRFLAVMPQNLHSLFNSFSLSLGGASARRLIAFGCKQQTIICRVASNEKYKMRAPIIITSYGEKCLSGSELILFQILWKLPKGLMILTAKGINHDPRSRQAASADLMLV